jgi:uncharacterized repeat protein (TIGR03803 family)
MKSGRAILRVCLVIAVTLAFSLAAQTFQTLHSFNAVTYSYYYPAYRNADGARPIGSVILSSNRLVGTAAYGGDFGFGTVFAVNPDGSGFTNLHEFNGEDGFMPVSLILSDGTLYGVTAYGCAAHGGTVFSLRPDGTGFTNLYFFSARENLTNADGANPSIGLIVSGNTLYGLAGGGGAGFGTVFAVNTDGTGFTNLHSFIGGGDGAYPRGQLLLVGGNLYGTTENGGATDTGTVFALATNGANYRIVHEFTGTTDDRGAVPQSGLVCAGDTLFGVTCDYDSRTIGTVFKVATNGAGFTVLHSFGAAPFYGNTNSDGAFPFAGLILAGDTLYGTTHERGNFGVGTVFAVKTNGTAFTNLHQFSQPWSDSSFSSKNYDGASVRSSLLLVGSDLFGTAPDGGVEGSGTVFRFSLAPQLTVMPAGVNLVLTWPTNVAGFDCAGFTLQSSTNLGASAGWQTHQPGATLVNGLNTVTNLIVSPQHFFRLNQ